MGSSILDAFVCLLVFSFFDLFYVCRLCNCTFFLTFVLTGLTCFVFFACCFYILFCLLYYLFSVLLALLA